MAGKNYAHINAIQGSVQLLAPAPTELVNVCINTLGTTGNILTLYDSNSAANASAANTIAVINTTATVGVLNMNLQCKNGLCAQMTVGVAGDATVVWG